MTVLLTILKVIGWILLGILGLILQNPSNYF